MGNNLTTLSSIYALIKEAFATAQVKDGTEQDFANRLRASTGYIPELAQVIELDGQIIAHIILTRIYLEKAEQTLEMLLLAPICVKLPFRNAGVGRYLIRETLSKAKSMGYQAVFLVGNPEYYSRFGFTSITAFGIEFLGDIPHEYIMACELIDGTLAGQQGKQLIMPH